ncbi:MAG: hypothetical protein FJ405_15555 [Verrucomicrobia bacterium]|nr:hypothetical protein [Verrucomicrobiota bacterium]
MRRLATTSDVIAMAAGRGSVRGWLAGSGRRLFSSSDGQTWTQTTEMPEVITAIWHSTVDWTLVGLNGMVRASRDGMTWKEVIYDSSPIQPRADLWSVSYGNGTWLMGGSQGALVAGLTTAHTRGFAVRSTELRGESLRDDFHALGHGGSSWVLLGNMKQVIRGGSTVSAAWPVPGSISHTDPLGRPRIVLSIATHPSVWIAVGLDGYVSQSSDGGRSFSQVLDSGTSANFHVVRQSDGLFVAAGERGVVRVFRLGQSVPTWGNVRFGFPVDHVTWLSLAHARGLWMLIGSGGVTAVSTNGMDWNPGPMLPEPVELYSLHGDQDSWVAVGEHGSIYVRSDVGPWERVVSPTGADLKHVTFANEQWVACGEEGTLLVAAHPRRWTPVRVPVPVVITAMRFIQDHWVLGGGGGLGLIHRGAIPVSFGLPSDATLGVRWSQHTPGRFVLFWKAAGAEDDFLESSGSPASGRWRPIDQQAERQGAEMQVVLPVQTGAAAYYRLRR